MKKTALYLMAICLSITFHPFQSNASTSASLVASIPVESEQAKALLQRLDEIKSMDKSNLKPSEKKNLRMEVHSIQHQLKDLGGGFYFSISAIIIILLLLIILF